MKTIELRPLTDAELARFMAKVTIDPATGCWAWTAARGSNGYGKFGLDGTLRQAHRVAYTTFKGSIPAGLVLDHTCRNRACVNPSHLEPMSQRENLHALGSQALPALQVARTTCPRGHKLVGANRVPSELARDRRKCLACHRATAARRVDRLRHGVIWTDAEFRADADRRYEELMISTP